MKEYASTFFNTYKEYKIPENFKRVIVGFHSDRHPCFNGIAFYDKQGSKLLSLGTIGNPVEIILDDDERIVGIASRNEVDAMHYDF